MTKYSKHRIVTEPKNGRGSFDYEIYYKNKNLLQKALKSPYGNVSKGGHYAVDDDEYRTITANKEKRGAHLEKKRKTDDTYKVDVMEPKPILFKKKRYQQLTKKPLSYQMYLPKSEDSKVSRDAMKVTMLDDLKRYKFQKTAALRPDVRLNEFQKNLLEYSGDNVVVAHGVGSGKTLSSIAKFEKMRGEGKAKKALVLTPAAIRANYDEDGVRKFTDSKANVIGSKSEISSKKYKGVDPNADYNIMSYEMFIRDPARYIKESGADTVIKDEGHRARNTSTKLAKSLKAVRPLYKNHMDLTGSIISNSPSDIWPLIDVATNGQHTLGKSKQDFEKRYIARKYIPGVSEKRMPIKGFKHKGELKDQLSGVVDYVDEDAAREVAHIPKKNLSVKKIPLSGEQKRLYELLLKESPKAKKLITQKRMETMTPEEISQGYNTLVETRKLMNSIGHIKPGVTLSDSARETPKTKALIDDAMTHLKDTPDGQAIAFSHLINGGIDVLQKGFQDRGQQPGLFVGKGNQLDGKKITEESRQGAVKDFKNRKTRTMLISGAGAEGVSLGNTTWEGVLDPFYNPEKMNQMEARGIRAYGLNHRKPEDRQVQVNRYLATMPKKFGILKDSRMTPDEFIYEIAQNKDKQNQVFRDLLNEVQKEKFKKRKKEERTEKIKKFFGR